MPAIVPIDCSIACSHFAKLVFMKNTEFFTFILKLGFTAGDSKNSFCL